MSNAALLQHSLSKIDALETKLLTDAEPHHPISDDDVQIYCNLAEVRLKMAEHLINQAANDLNNVYTKSHVVELQIIAGRIGRLSQNRNDT